MITDYIFLSLLTLSAWYPVTLGILALLIVWAYRQRHKPLGKLWLVLLLLLWGLFALAAWSLHT